MPPCFSTAIGPVQAPPALCAALSQRLADGPAALAELAQLPQAAGQLAQVVQTLQLMMMAGLVHPGSPATEGVPDRAEALTRWFKRHGIALQVLPQCGTASRTDPRS